MTADDLPLLLWNGDNPGCDIDDDNEYEGLFQGHYLERVSPTHLYRSSDVTYALGYAPYFHGAINCTGRGITFNPPTKCNSSQDDHR
jgi:hypothetical protein